MRRCLGAARVVSLVGQYPCRRSQPVHPAMPRRNRPGGGRDRTVPARESAPGRPGQPSTRRRRRAWAGQRTCPPALHRLFGAVGHGHGVCRASAPAACSRPWSLGRARRPPFAPGLGADRERGAGATGGDRVGESVAGGDANAIRAVSRLVRLNWIDVSQSSGQINCRPLCALDALGLQVRHFRLGLNGRDANEGRVYPPPGVAPPVRFLSGSLPDQSDGNHALDVDPSSCHGDSALARS